MTGDFVPLYAVYPLLFTDRGVSPAGISLLFAVWSVTSFAAEVPSGVLADLVSRRLALAAASACFAGCFVLWTFAQTFAGFAAGFVLWGLSGALSSGAWEALLYDELARTGAREHYTRVLGTTESLCAAAALAGILVASPLMAVGGYGLVGGCSIAMVVLQGLVVALLPRAPLPSAPPRSSAPSPIPQPPSPQPASPRPASPRPASPRPASAQLPSAQLPSAQLPSPQPPIPQPPSGLTDRLAPALRSGLLAAVPFATPRRLTVGIAVLVGACSFDEYLPLLAREHGAATPLVPVLLAIATAGQVAGTALAGRADRLSPRRFGAVVCAAAVLVAVGAAARPLGWFVALAAGYGLLNTAMVVAQGRLQHTVPDECRATVTSLVNLAAEAGVLAVFAVYGFGSRSLGVAATTVVICVPVLAAGLLATRWLPGAQSSGGQLLVEVRAGIAHPVGMQKDEPLVGPEPEDGSQADRADIDDEHDGAAVREAQRVDEQREDQQ